MSYFSQRKKQERVNLFLNLLLGIIGILTVLSFFDSADNRVINMITSWRFHYYIITCLLFVYALLSQYFAHALIALLLLIVNYAAVASTANIFTNASNNNPEHVSIIYQNETRHLVPLIKEAINADADVIGVNHRKPVYYDAQITEPYQLVREDAASDKSFILTSLDSQRAGKLHLTADRVASFLSVIKGSRSFVFINIDFSNLKNAEEKVVFDNLAEFVLKQDEPVIIIGDFGIPAWSKTFQSFLNKTELEVKNHIIMSDGSSLFDLFTIPSINVLAYRNVGLQDIKFLPRKKASNHPLLFELSF